MEKQEDLGAEQPHSDENEMITGALIGSCFQ